MTDLRISVLCSLLSLSVMSACSKQAAPPADAQPAPGAQAAQAAAPAAQPSVDQAATTAVAAQDAPTVTGPVLETMNAANYTYVGVKTDRGDGWAASGEFKVAVGDRVTLALEMPMENFRSQTLKRDFPIIYFTTRIAREGDALPAAAAMMSAHGQSGAAPAAAAQVTEPIQPAPGGVTVAKVAHIAELRTALAQVYAAASLTGPTYARAALTAGATVITAADIEELRAAVLAIW